MQRELERWRHGTTIEGDFVCPNALAGDALRRERDEAREVHRGALETAMSMYDRVQRERDELAANYKNAAKNWGDMAETYVAQRDALQARVGLLEVAARGVLHLCSIFSSIRPCDGHPCVEALRDALDAELKETP